MDFRPLRATSASAARAAVTHRDERDPLSEGDATFGHALIALTPRLRSYARHLSRDEDVADDLVQDAMVRAWRARASFDPGTNLKAWTFRILRNLFLSQRRRTRFVGDYDELAAERVLARPEGQSLTVELNDVRAGFALLPEDQRNALHMVAIEELAYDTAARTAGISVGTLKSRVSRARTALRKILASAPRPLAEPRQSPEPPSDAPRTNAWALAKAARELRGSVKIDIS